MVQRKVIVRGATNQALDELDAADIPDLSAAYEAAGGIATHSADTTAVHGVADTSALVVDGDAAGGQLSGTYPNPSVAASHSGSTHAATQAAAEATAAGALTTHEGAADPHTGYLKESDFDDVDFLVGTATGHTGAEIVVGTTPGGELGGTWASPTVDATHSGSSHAGVVSTHEAAGDPHPAYLLEADANYVDLTDGGATVLHNHTTSRNVSAASQVISANTVTYLTGSGILIPAAGFVVGQVYRWLIAVNKTNAGTAAPVWTFRVGTNQTTADTTYLTITGTAQVATTSGTLIEIVAFVRTVSATVGIITAGINTGAASFGIGGSAVSGNLTNNGDAGERFGLCVNTGASAAWTVNSVTGELI